MSDSNFWGLLVVPVGVLVCFGPPLFVWLRAELRDQAAQKKDDRR